MEETYRNALLAFEEIRIWMMDNLHEDDDVFEYIAPRLRDIGMFLYYEEK